METITTFRNKLNKWIDDNPELANLEILSGTNLNGEVELANMIFTKIINDDGEECLVLYNNYRALDSFMDYHNIEYELLINQSFNITEKEYNLE